MTAEGVKVWFPIKAGVLRRTVDHVKAVDGVSVTIREGQTVGVVGESGSGKTTLGLALLRLLRSDGRIQFLGRELQGLGTRALRPLRREMQIVFQDPYGSLSPRQSVGQIVGEGLGVHHVGRSAEEREAADRRRRWRRSASTRRCATATRTSCRAVSGSGSRWPARSCSSRG